MAQPPSRRRAAQHEKTGTPLQTPTGVRLEVSDETLLAWFHEDLGDPPHDVTTEAVIREGHRGQARILTREDLVVSGLEEANRLFHLAGVETEPQAQDGDRVEKGSDLARVQGPTRVILAAERTALNLLTRASGIASFTREIQDRIAQVNPECRVSATRKTTPGFRIMEKRAVIHAGGDPHRYGLFDMVLIKDNHVSAGGPLEGLIQAARQAHPGLGVEVEVESVEQAETAARCGADWILVDNQGPEALARIAAAARRIAPDIRIEASGGIRAQDVHRFAPHADRISMGALTQSAPAKDIGLDWMPG